MNILILLVTDILNNGSYIYYNQASEDILNNCFVSKSSIKYIFDT